MCGAIKCASSELVLKPLQYACGCIIGAALVVTVIGFSALYMSGKLPDDTLTGEPLHVFASLTCQGVGVDCGVRCEPLEHTDDCSIVCPDDMMAEEDCPQCEVVPAAGVCLDEVTNCAWSCVASSCSPACESVDTGWAGVVPL